MHTSLDSRKNEIEKRLSGGESLRSVARTIGITYQGLQYHRRIWGAKILRPARTSGPGHASWGNGEYIDRWGYKMIRAPERLSRNPYTPEHILVAEKKIGRQIVRGEHVHHLNGNKSDNSPENLLVCTASQHRILHRQLEELAIELVRKGDIAYRRGRYHWKVQPTVAS
jgi:hypothetical protein